MAFKRNTNLNDVITLGVEALLCAVQIFRIFSGSL